MSTATGLSLAQRRLLESRLERARAEVGRSRRIPRRGDDGPAPLSWSQEMFYLVETHEAVPSVHSMARCFEIHGELDADALAEALAYLGRRHDILRTRFGARPAEPIPETFQVVDPEATVTLETVDLREVSEAERRGAARRRLDAIARQPFDPAAPPLVRAALLRHAPRHHDLVLAMHHLIVDGWSLGLLLHELGKAYDAYRAGREPELPELPIQYADYAAWERDRLQGEALEELAAYWEGRLGGGLPRLELPTDHPRPQRPSFRGALRSLSIDPETSRRIAERSRIEGVSEYMLFLAAYKALLAHLSGQEDILVASPHANRTGSQTEALLGCFINLLLLRTDLSGDPTGQELLGRVKETAVGAGSHAEMPYMEVVMRCAPPDHPPEKPLFQAVLTFQNALPPRLELTGAHVGPPRILDRGTTDLDLILSVEKVNGGYACALVYAVDLFEAATVDRFLELYREILAAMALRPERRLSAMTTGA